MLEDKFIKVVRAKDVQRAKEEGKFAVLSTSKTLTI
jgi:hypothetical protein